MGEGSNDNASSIIEDSDGGYILSGQTTSFNVGNEAIYLVKLDSIGNTCNVSGGGGIMGTGGTAPSGGTVTVVTSAQSEIGSKGIGGVLLSICSSNVGINETLNYSGFSLFPNPSNGIFLVFAMIF
ncbi:MAG: hypothetical protein IPG39_11780 [Bacteroidetes bacterium]|nr:hypothetical protein [Bacteroidota bacterium]